MHVPTIGHMPDDATRIQTAHGELTLREIAEMLPSTGDLMASIGTSWWKCAHAARGGNWELAAYFARRTRGLLRKLAVLRPKYAGDVASYESERIAAVLAACDGEDTAAFETAYAAAVGSANELHAKWGKPYIRWTLPEEPPTDLDLSRGGRAR